MQAETRRRPVSFLFLGETLLMPHLYPVLESLARAAPQLPIDAWVATQTHEVLIGNWIAQAGLGSVRIRRAPGYRRTEHPELGINPQLPAKIPGLLRLLPHLLRARAVICAEQTSLWIPRVASWLPGLPPFIQTLHGAGTINSGRSGVRRDAAALIMVASEQERDSYLAHGMDPARIRTTGYVKAGFEHLASRVPAFAQDRPVILYNPHWQRFRSSWWEWGTEVIRRIQETGRYNLIFAPHQRLVEGVSDLRALCRDLARRDDTICDIESFAAVDGSYTRAADIYLGDTSSQVLEFLQRPRPVVFLDAQGCDWKDNPTLSMWHLGEVVTDPAQLVPALESAQAAQPSRSEGQAAFIARQMGAADGSGPDRAAHVVLEFLNLEGAANRSRP